MELLQSYWERFNSEINKYEDPRTKNWFLVSSPLPTIIISICYCFIVKVIGPRYMKNRKPYQLKSFLLAYNLFQVILSAWIFYGFGKLGWFGVYSYKCQPVGTSRSPDTYKVLKLSYIYYLSKFLELFDTVAFILRKKESQVTSLHVFHHGIMPLGSWLCVKFVPEGNMTIIGFLNSFVHIVMYSYYLLSGLGPKVQKYLWWKKYITMLQLGQFVLIALHSMQSLMFGCRFPKFISWYIVVQTVSFFVLFFKFYKTSYVKKPVFSVKNGSSNKKFD